MGLKLTVRTVFILQTVGIVCALVAVVVGLTVGLRTPAPPNGGSPTLPPATTEIYATTDLPEDQTDSDSFRFAAVVADATICSGIGTEILGRHGGSAVDAAIAAMLCVGVVNRHSTGLGGGHFMTIYDVPRGGSERVMTTILARETAPASAYEDMFVDNLDASTRGGLAIGVPGEIKGFYKAWEMFGRIPWVDLFTPTIRLAREGYEVQSHLANAIRINEITIRLDPNLREIFLKEDGSILEEGDIARDEKLAVTLEKIAQDPEAFYVGQLAQDIVDDIADYSGNITLEDLQNYTAKVKDALKVTMNNSDLVLYTPRPPSSGLVLQHIMKLLDGYGWTPDAIADLDSSILTYHRITEAFKFAYAKRSGLGDEDYWDVSEFIANLTSDAYNEAIRGMVNDTHTQDIWYYGPEFDGYNSSGTAHLSVLAPGGSAVALTSTINLYFGSKSRGSRTGIIFNNEMDDFSTPGTSNSFGVPASPSNFISPGKMPMSSMAPAIFINGKGDPVLINGASGGTRITSMMAFVAIHNIWLGKSIDVATDMKRIHHQLVPEYVSYEAGFDEEILEGLRLKGHDVRLYGNYMAVVGSIDNQCARYEDDCAGQACVHAVSDSRKGGSPDGF